MSLAATEVYMLGQVWPEAYVCMTTLPFFVSRSDGNVAFSSWRRGGNKVKRLLALFSLVTVYCWAFVCVL